MAKATAVYQLKVELEEVRPRVWRRVQVPATITLEDLHAVLQTAMGWTDSHLHEFTVGGVRYGVPDADWDDDVRDEGRVRLADVAGEGSRFSYAYDFGDGWQHRVTVEAVVPAEPGQRYPRCVAGSRACPPEDVGGPGGYADLLAALADPEHPEHELLRSWSGGDVDPERFDVEEVDALFEGRRPRARRPRSAALDDPAPAGPAELLARAMLAEGVDLTDEAEVGRWLTAFNDRPYEERVALTGGPVLPGHPGGDLPPLPPVRLAPAAELAAAVRRSPLMQDLARLAGWLSAGRAVTDTGVLRAAQARAAVADLGLEPPGSGGEHRMRSARDHGPLQALWALAEAAEFLEVRGRQAVPGPAYALWTDADAAEEDVVDLWADVFESVLGLGIDMGLEQDYRFAVHDVVDEHLPLLLMRLYLAGAGTVEEFVAEVDPGGPDGEGAPPPGWREVGAGLLRTMVERLALLGAVEEGDGGVTLTALGLHGVREQLELAGFEAPVLADVGDMTAADLLDVLVSFPEDRARTEMLAWVAARPPEAAAAEILAAAAEGSPGRRSMAFMVLEQIGPAAEPAVRQQTADLPLRPYAHLWLVSRGVEEGAPLDPADAAWMLADVCASLLEHGEPGDVAEHLAELGPAAEQLSAVEWLRTAGHPAGADVLTALGAAAADRKVAKAARKAAFRVRSAGSGRP